MQFDQTLLLSVLKAQEEGYVNAAVILPSIVHGVGRSPLPGRASVFFQFSVRDILQRRDAGGVPRKGVGYIGEGTARVGAVRRFFHTVSCQSLTYL